MAGRTRLAALAATALLFASALPSASAVDFHGSVCPSADCVTWSIVGDRVELCVDGQCTVVAPEVVSPPGFPAVPPAPAPPPVPGVPRPADLPVVGGLLYGLDELEEQARRLVEEPPVVLRDGCVGVGDASSGFFPVAACAYDDDGDGMPDGGAYFVGAGVLFVAGAGAATFGAAHDRDGDGVPETWDVTPVFVVVGILWAEPCPGNLPPACIWFICLVCERVDVRLRDADGDGLPNRVILEAPVVGTVEHTV